MTAENRAAQIEIKKRTTYFSCLSKAEMIRAALICIEDGMYRIRHREGEVVFPHALSERDEAIVRQLVRRKFGNYANRLDVFAPVRLEEGIGTVISIKEKGRR